MPVDTTTLERALDAIKKQYGADSIRDSQDIEDLERISTGDPMLNWCIGGGVPVGRWAHFYGGYASAKTLTALNVIANAQKMGKACVYYNIEKQYDPVWFASWGVDVDALTVVDGTIIEEIGEKLETLLGSAHVHVLDSLAQAVPNDELAGKATDWLPGIAARTWGKVIRRANERFDPKENTVILINQLRSTFGYGGAESPTGGKSIEYISSLSLAFKKSSWLFKDKNGVLQDEGTNKATLSKDSEPEGIEFQVRAAKSRVSTPHRTARLRLDFDTGTYDELWCLSRAAVFFGVVKVNGSWYTFPDGTKAQGEAGIRAYISANPSFRSVVAERLKQDV